MRSDCNEEIAAEEKAIADIKKMARENGASLSMLWNLGDGRGGGILDMIANEIGRDTQRPASINVKKVIKADLRTRVFERNAYRCVYCQTHLNLTVDHIKPESKGGTLDFDNLQTLCRSCNSTKGVRE